MLVDVESTVIGCVRMLVDDAGELTLDTEVASTKPVLEDSAVSVLEGLCVRIRLGLPRGLEKSTDGVRTLLEFGRSLSVFSAESGADEYVGPTSSSDEGWGMGRRTGLGGDGNVNALDGSALDARLLEGVRVEVTKGGEEGKVRIGSMVLLRSELEEDVLRCLVVLPVAVALLSVVGMSLDVRPVGESDARVNVASEGRLLLDI